MKTGTLVLVRHGQSVWNLENRFTGWVDVPLSKKGIQEAKKAGKLLKHYDFDVAYTSTLIRAIETLYFIFNESKTQKVPIIHHTEGKLHTWAAYKGDVKKEIPVFEHDALDERYYGALQGLNKQKTARQYGKEKVRIWRRSFEIRPPEGESLKDTAKRTIPYFRKEILTKLKKGQNVLVAAHGNSLRSIIMFLESIPEATIPSLELPTGVPVVYHIDYKGNVIKKKMLH
ncbi:2,3-bisphosphoglycerate-dependent phosphoglycerate mutase [Candidatus Woesearchaeota archaeon]|nr:MAG: 2,3-bisphosphoglycerate-dependent phosphoglycerate mutase [Candidatus Woesearchaeota archaeon]